MCRNGSGLVVALQGGSESTSDFPGLSPGASFASHVQQWLGESIEMSKLGGDTRIFQVIRK